jgi:hypothetical protein
VGANGRDTIFPYAVDRRRKVMQTLKQLELDIVNERSALQPRRHRNPRAGTPSLRGAGW